MEVKIPESVRIVELEPAPFKNVKNEKTKAYSYEISNIEILRGTAESLTQPNCKISMNVSILLNDVCDVNGVPLPF